MKKYIALLLALLLAFGLAACGDDTIDSTTESSTTVSQGASNNQTTISNGTTAPVTNGSTTVDTTMEDPEYTAANTTYVSGGVTVPIGTKPTTVTSTTAPSTTTTATTTVQVGEPDGGSSTGSTVTTTTTTTTTATSTTGTTATQPTEPSTPPLYIALPEIGSDIDVTNRKDRIRVSAAAAWMNEDGTIGVQLSFTNYTSNWITEETNYIEYTCYDKDGKVVQQATKLLIGVIDTKRHSTRSYTFDVPAATAEVKITRSKIVYWTEWS